MIRVCNKKHLTRILILSARYKQNYSKSVHKASHIFFWPGPHAGYWQRQLTEAGQGWNYSRRVPRDQENVRYWNWKNLRPGSQEAHRLRIRRPPSREFVVLTCHDCFYITLGQDSRNFKQIQEEGNTLVLTIFFRNPWRLTCVRESKKVSYECGNLRNFYFWIYHFI